MTSTPAQPRGLLLDVGGTLLREHDYDLAPGVFALQPLSRRAGEALARELVAAIDRVHAGGATEFCLRDWLTQHRSEFAFSDDVGELELRLWQETVELSPMPGVAAALERLDGTGLRLACVSNANFSARALEYELERAGLRERLAFVISSADIGVRKPDRQIFDQAVQRIGLDPAELWFVGDSWVNDVEGAAAAGLHPVWLVESESQVAPSATPHTRVSSWAALERLLSPPQGLRRDG